MKRIPLAGSGIAYIGWGPLRRRDEADDLERLAVCLALKAEYVGRRGLVLRILGPIGPPEWVDGARDRLVSAGFEPTYRAPGYRAIILRIDRPLAEIRMNLTSEWRNNLNGAERKGLELRTGTDKEIFADFALMFRSFLRRKGFDANLDAAFFAEVQSRLPEAERMQVTLAEKDGEPVAGHVLSALGDTAVFVLGATLHAALKTKASYLLHWHAIETARARRMKFYDVGGIDPQRTPGVYRFKRGLNGTEISSPGPFELAPRGVSGITTRTAEKLYLFIQGLRRTRNSRLPREHLPPVVSPSHQ